MQSVRSVFVLLTAFRCTHSTLLPSWSSAAFYFILYPYEDKTRDIWSNIALPMGEFSREEPKQTWGVQHEIYSALGGNIKRLLNYGYSLLVHIKLKQRS